MGAVGLVFRTELRRRWRSWMAVAVLISLAGGLVMAAVAAGRRTESAFPRFVAAHGFDAVVYATKPVPKVVTLPGVSSVTELVIADTGQPTCKCTHQISSSAAFAVEVVPPKDRSPFALISGRLPDPSATNQVLASFTLQRDYGVQIGTVIHVPFEAPSQASAYNNPNTGLPKPEGPTIGLRVVGIEATEFEFPSGTAPVYLLYASQAFARVVLPQTAKQYQYYVRLFQGAAGIPRFGNEANTLDLGTGTVGYSSEDGAAATIEASIHPQAIGWWILAALAALVALAVLGQALARQSVVESEDYPTMAAVGLDRRQLLALGMARNLVVGIAGAVGAMTLAAALSPLAPFGEARIAEISTGVSFDTAVLLLGALGTLGVVLVLGFWPAGRAARTLRTDDGALRSRRSVVATQLAAMGAPPSAVIGVRNALERKSAGATVPLGSALLGMVLAVMALCGTGIFGASLSHLTATPRLYGDPEELSFNPPNPALLKSLLDNRAVTGITVGFGGGEISINNKIVGSIAATAVRGRLLFSAVDGHLPNRDSQIGLGVTTMRQVGATVGSVVHVTVQTRSGGKRTVPFVVVSQDSFPVLGGFVSLGTGALLTTAGLERAFCSPGRQLEACRQAMGNTSKGGIRVSFVSGPRGRAAIKHYLDTYPSITAVPITPTSLVNFGEAVNFPLIFGAMLALFGAATLVHLLVVSVSRRRREIGLLKALGLVNGQVASVVAWQATTLAFVGIVIGVPLGIVVGRAVWTAFGSNLGVVPVSVVPMWLIAGLAAGVIVVANLLAVAPALTAARIKPGLLLRTM